MIEGQPFNISGYVLFMKESLDSDPTHRDETPTVLTYVRQRLNSIEQNPDASGEPAKC